MVDKLSPNQEVSFPMMDYIKALSECGLPLWAISRSMHDLESLGLKLIREKEQVFIQESEDVRATGENLMPTEKERFKLVFSQNGSESKLNPIPAGNVNRQKNEYHQRVTQPVTVISKTNGQVIFADEPNSVGVGLKTRFGSLSRVS